MIRIVLITAAFFSVTIALLVVQPGPDPRAPLMPEGEMDVTRADTGVDLAATADKSLDHATIEPETVNDDDALGFGLMDGLSDQPAEPGLTENRADGIIASLGNAAINQGNAKVVSSQGEKPELELMVIRALNQGQSEDYIDALVNHAASAGTVDVPRNLITVDGRVDTTALLSVLGPQSAGPGPGRDYEVEAGDTLASIAYRFYGSTAMQTEIFDANKDKISSPSNIRAGLTLVLPAK